MEVKTLRGLLIEELRDMHSAEQQILEALPLMIGASTNERLQHALREHEEETQDHADRLERVLALLDESVGASVCEGMRGIIRDGQGLVMSASDDEARDAAVIAAVQKVEHYEIAGYGTVITWARTLGEDEVANLLEDTLAEEKSADETLTKIASGGLFTAGVNEEAAEA